MKNAVAGDEQLQTPSGFEALEARNAAASGFEKPETASVDIRPRQVGSQSDSMRTANPLKILRMEKWKGRRGVMSRCYSSAATWAPAMLGLAYADLGQSQKT
ncbi:hypothetical protein ODS41_05305 [Pyrobaculum sp. 3827-6]|uniref:hypothetical protein n=1 Tax=Pyrobaculum sp. 3827-6 TaxID=2983604 RepID=UPI0021DB5C7D|nr:hypothetical protein [Pyrobaculum sp. 3827-6]MCU7787337.1 hypothetical protein [Pyrobaculum sp. 3827-6]